MVGAEDGGEAPEGVVLDEADVAFLRHHEVVVAAEVVKASLESEGAVGLPFGQEAGHPCFDGTVSHQSIVHQFAPLPIVRAFNRQMLGVKVEVAAIHLLILGRRLVVLFVRLTRLQTEVHEEQRGA